MQSILNLLLLLLLVFSIGGPVAFSFMTHLHHLPPPPPPMKNMSPSTVLYMSILKLENWALLFGQQTSDKMNDRPFNKNTSSTTPRKQYRHFQSRPLVDFQKDLEAGKVRHLFPVMFAKERVQSGELRPSDIPYEQREGGTWTNKDVNVGYVPSGMSVHEWHEFQRAEKKRTMKNKNFAAFGPTTFQSRSLQGCGFQEDLEQGKANHLFPVMFAKEQIKRGIMKEEEVPYMQRLGSWDNSDIKSSKKKEWSETDKRMASK